MTNKTTILSIIAVLLIAAAGVAAYFYFPNMFSKKPTETQNFTIPTEQNNQNSLDLSGQNLEKLPQYVLEITSLEELNISNNKIGGALPAEIRNLRSLKKLDASNNLMTGVPAEIGQLSNLEELNLSNNKLTGLPYELGNLKNLRTLNLSGNAYAQQDLQIILQSLPANVNVIR